MGASMERDAVAARLSAAGADEFITPNRVRMLCKLSGVYEEQRVLSSTSAPPLHKACDDRHACWRGLPEAARPKKAEPWGLPGDKPGSIIWPWIGERYRPGGVVLLTLNFRSSDTEATVALEYLAAWHVRENLRAGRKRVPEWNSTFAYGSLATAAAVISGLEGQALKPEPDPEWLYEISVMESVARVQLVKCTPVDTAVRRGSPTGAMCERCPPRFLWKELDVLRPSVLVVFGDRAFRELNGQKGVNWRCSDDYCRGTLKYGDGDPVQLLWLWHPSNLGKWLRSQKALVRSLQRKPLSSSRARASGASREHRLSSSL